ncbi:hypothetical protein GCM10010353_68410 [Streptomyces chryseus]|uniref:Uncharacterized protein n=1 Tax=Streptomyces chryseus TaxID=68186 RepID=A0ABQ3E529_9ACTN|nr:hypothetical protein GCM10010353_68410 [Streptomyces chryseus]GHB26209.1 hypothetical protein GCM10010346_57350 [Streptomyces chryseus]
MRAGAGWTLRLTDQRRAEAAALGLDTSSTAQVRAQSPTRTSGAGEVSRLATSASNDLSVRQMGARAARTHLIDDPSHIQPAQKLGSGRQSTQTLHHGLHHNFKALTLGPGREDREAIDTPGQRQTTGPGHSRTGHTIRINDPRSTGLDPDIPAAEVVERLPSYE